jgi:hypothetical protein
MLRTIHSYDGTVESLVRWLEHREGNVPTSHALDILRCQACGRSVGECHGVKRCKGGE